MCDIRKQRTFCLRSFWRRTRSMRTESTFTSPDALTTGRAGEPAPGIGRSCGRNKRTRREHPARFSQGATECRSYPATAATRRSGTASTVWRSRHCRAGGGLPGPVSDFCRCVRHCGGCDRGVRCGSQECGPGLRAGKPRNLDDLSASGGRLPFLCPGEVFRKFEARRLRIPSLSHA